MSFLFESLPLSKDRRSQASPAALLRGALLCVSFVAATIPAVRWSCAQWPLMGFGKEREITLVPSSSKCNLYLNSVLSHMKNTVKLEVAEDF
jgi:hypothetical protein